MLGGTGSTTSRVCGTHGCGCLRVVRCACAAWLMSYTYVIILHVADRQRHPCFHALTRLSAETDPTVYSSGHCTQTHSRWNLILNGTVSALHLRMVLYLPCKLRQKRNYMPSRASGKLTGIVRYILHSTLRPPPSPLPLLLHVATALAPGTWGAGMPVQRVPVWCAGAGAHRSLS